MPRVKRPRPFVTPSYLIHRAQWRLGSDIPGPDRPFGPERFAFVFSTGRCGTLHLTEVLGDRWSQVLHEKEHDQIHTVMESYYRPIARTNDQELASTFVRDHKIPDMLSRMRSRRRHVYVDTGHQIIFGVVPALLEQLRGRVQLVRLRRDRVGTAVSFLSTPEERDPWMPAWRDPETGHVRTRWAYSPEDAVVCYAPDPALWQRMKRVQRYLWYVDEVERQWQRLRATYDFPALEVQLEELNPGGYRQIAKFLGIGYDRELMGVRHHTTEQMKGRARVEYDEAELAEAVREYGELVGDAPS